MNQIKTIIVDDEPEAREGIKLLLENDPEISILKLCKNGIEAIDTIKEHSVDLVFLDIQMPLINGFEVVNSIAKEQLPHIIFVTAYDQHALKAFEIHAVDYILKPFTNSRFLEGLVRAKQLIGQQKLQQTQEKLKAFANHLAQKQNNNDQLLISTDSEEKEKTQRLVIKEKGQIIFIPLDDIIWLEAYDYYVKVHLSNRFFLIRQSLKKLQDRLRSWKFIRIHKSFIINQACVREIKKGNNGDYIVKLNNNIELKVSRTYKDSIKKISH